MKKLLILGIISCCFLLISPFVTSAEENTHNHSSVHNNSLLEADHSIIVPNELPCDYWPDSRHRWQDGTPSSYYVTLYTHPHYDPTTGITFNCTVSQLYIVPTKYCACGYHKTLPGYPSGDALHSVGY